jgi:hypothetical protein
VRPKLVALGLILPEIPSVTQGDIAFWYTNVVEQINSLPERLW